MIALPEPSSRKDRLTGLTKGIIVSSFLFPSLLMFNVIQVLTLVVRFVSPSAFRKANRWMANVWWGWCAIWAEKLFGTQVVMHGDVAPMRENAVVLLNHQEMADVTVMFAFARSKDRLGDLKWFVKNIIKYVPGVGWGMLFLDCLYVKRNWTDDKKAIQRVFSRILKERIPLWLMIFAEGTRVRPSKLAQSQEYARKLGREPLKHLLYPRTKGFVATVEALREHLDAVYDVTIGYVDGVPSLWQWIKGQVHLVHVHVVRFPIDTLPADGQGLSDWLVTRYEVKDALLDDYFRLGTFGP